MAIYPSRSSDGREMGFVAGGDRRDLGLSPVVSASCQAIRCSDLDGHRMTNVVDDTKEAVPVARNLIAPCLKMEQAVADLVEVVLLSPRL